MWGRLHDGSGCVFLRVTQKSEASHGLMAAVPGLGKIACTSFSEMKRVSRLRVFGGDGASG